MLWRTWMQIKLIRHAPNLRPFSGRLEGVQIAYETWGELNADKSNAVLLHTGLSASSHAKSHAVSRWTGGLVFVRL